VLPPFVFGHFRKRAERSLEGDALSRIIVHVFRGDDLFRGEAIDDPIVERRQQVVLQSANEQTDGDVA
jgi:hypothetical protein